jgi:hypothetical protein
MVMFFSLTNSSATFQTIIDILFREEIMQDYIIVYMDDILIVTESNNIEDVAAELGSATLGLVGQR